MEALFEMKAIQFSRLSPELDIFNGFFFSSCSAHSYRHIWERNLNRTLRIFKDRSTRRNTSVPEPLYYCMYKFPKSLFLPVQYIKWLT